MGLLNEFFLAADDDQALEAVQDGAVAAGFAEVIQASGMTSLEVEYLEKAITGRRVLPAPLDLLMLDDDDPEGPFVVQFTEGLIDAMLELPTAEVLAAAGRWASFGELRGADVSDLASLLEDLIRLVALGASSGRRPYLWVCL